MDRETTGSRDDGAALRAFLGVRDVACPSCAYNLRGLSGATCPECGEALRLQVGLVEARLAGWVFGLVGLSIGVGFTGVLVVWGVTAGMLGGMAAQLAEEAPLLVALPVEVACLAAWIRWGRAVRRLPAARRWAMALGCWALSLVMAGWFIASVG
jgi:hypothetical protein